MKQSSWGGGGGEEKAYLDKTRPQSGHGPKGQSPIHVKVAGGWLFCMCVLWKGGTEEGGGGKRGLFEALGMKRSGTQSSSYFKYAPSHLHSFAFSTTAGEYGRTNLGSQFLGAGLKRAQQQNTTCGPEGVHHRGL